MGTFCDKLEVNSRCKTPAPPSGTFADKVGFDPR